MRDWAELVERIKHPQDEVTIDVVGKYVGLEDAYKSLLRGARTTPASAPA